MTAGIGAKAIATAVRLGGAALVLVTSPAPAAAAGQARAVLSVTATVVPACSIERGPTASPDIACSSGATVTTKTSARHDEQPLDEAAAILGAPVLRSGDVIFTAPVRAASALAPGAGANQPQYLTITY